MSINPEKAKRIEDRLNKLVKERNLDRAGLLEYLEACAAENVIDHAIRATSANSFYIHPNGTDGPTFDFFLDGDKRVLRALKVGES